MCSVAAGLARHDVGKMTLPAYSTGRIAAVGAFDNIRVYTHRRRESDHHQIPNLRVAAETIPHLPVARCPVSICVLGKDTLLVRGIGEQHIAVVPGRALGQYASVVAQYRRRKTSTLGVLRQPGTALNLDARRC